MARIIYRNGCWGCKKAQEVEEFNKTPLRSKNASLITEKYVCPKIKQHWEEYEQQQ